MMIDKLQKYFFLRLNFGTESKRFSFLQKFIVFSIIISSVMVIVESELSIYNKFYYIFDFFRVFFGVVFTLELIIRFFAVGMITKFSGFKGRIKYLFSFWTIIDILAILPLIVSGVHETYLLRLFRLMRLFSLIKLGRYSSSIKNVLDTIAAKKYELLFSVMIAFTLLLICSTFMYLIEGKEQPDEFGSIVRSMWWATVTLTTVGYGDVFPITTLGKIFGMLSAFTGISIVAIPSAILAGAFAKGINKKEYKNNKF